MNNLANIPESYLRNLDSQIKQILVSFGSETEDNVECMNHFELGYLGTDFGIKIKNKKIFISDIINALEDMEELPQEVKEYYPNMTDQEWQTSTRLSTLIFCWFEASLKKYYLKQLESANYKNKEKPINNRLIFSNT